MATLDSIDVTNNAIVNGNITVSGNTSLVTVSSSDLATLHSLTVSDNTTLNNDLTVSGNTDCTTISSSGLATLDSVDVTNNATVNGNLTISGNTKCDGLLALNYNKPETTSNTIYIPENTGIFHITNNDVSSNFVLNAPNTNIEGFILYLYNESSYDSVQQNLNDNSQLIITSTKTKIYIFMNNLWTEFKTGSSSSGNVVINFAQLTELERAEFWLKSFDVNGNSYFNRNLNYSNTAFYAGGTLSSPQEIDGKKTTLFFKTNTANNTDYFVFKANTVLYVPDENGVDTNVVDTDIFGNQRNLYENGQVKHLFYRTSVKSNKTVILFQANEPLYSADGNPYTNLIFNYSGQSATLIYMDNSWSIINTGAQLSSEHTSQAQNQSSSASNSGSNNSNTTVTISQSVLNIINQNQIETFDANRNVYVKGNTSFSHIIYNIGGDSLDPADILTINSKRSTYLFKTNNINRTDYFVFEDNIPLLVLDHNDVILLSEGNPIPVLDFEGNQRYMYEDGQVKHLFYRSSEPTNKVVIFFPETTNSSGPLYSGDGQKMNYLIFEQSGQSASLIYMDNSWSIINAGASISNEY